MNRLLEWLGSRLFPGKTESEPAYRPTSRRGRLKSALSRTAAAPPPLVDFDSELGGRIEDGGPGKNVLIRNKYVREDTGTHDTLKIIDDSLLEDQEEFGIDPYNTGQFDRSKSWNLRSKK